MAAALVAVACGGGTTARTGERAPGLSGTTLDGAAFDLSSLAGRPVIVNFWASWCTPCRNEFPLFRERLATLGSTDGLALIGVLYKDDPAQASAFLAELGGGWPTITDPDGTLASAYRVVAPPQTYFIDSSGVLRGMQIGEVRPEDFDTQYAKIRP